MDKNVKVSAEAAPLGVMVKDGKVVVSSLDVARVFGKEHRDILKAIRNLDCSLNFNERNFSSVEYRDSKGELRPACQMTRDGFTFLAMGFTGKQAAQFKEAYIGEFNRMEAALRDGGHRQWIPRSTQSEAEQILAFIGFRGARRVK